MLENWNEHIESSFQVTQDQFRQMFEKWVEQRKQSGFVLFEPSMSQVRQSVTEYGILPLGSKVVHDLAPHHKSMLLYGPACSGKTMLTHAIVTESGSNYFNLSPANLQVAVACPLVTCCLCFELSAHCGRRGPRLLQRRRRRQDPRVRGLL